MLNTIFQQESFCEVSFDKVISLNLDSLTITAESNIFTAFYVLGKLVIYYTAFSELGLTSGGNPFVKRCMWFSVSVMFVTHGTISYVTIFYVTILYVTIFCMSLF